MLCEFTQTKKLPNTWVWGFSWRRQKRALVDPKTQTTRTTWPQDDDLEACRLEIRRKSTRKCSATSRDCWIRWTARWWFAGRVRTRVEVRPFARSKNMCRIGKNKWEIEKQREQTVDDDRNTTSATLLESCSRCRWFVEFEHSNTRELAACFRPVQSQRSSLLPAITDCL